MYGVYRQYCKYCVYHAGMSEQRMGIRDFRENLGRRVEAAHFQGEPTVVESYGEPRAVLVQYEWWLNVTQGGADTPAGEHPA